MKADGVALSVKQPWAALLATGIKTVEVRTWPTTRRGTVFLHAAKVSDARSHGWTFLTTDELTAAAELGGGIIAVAELIDCVTYSSAEAFAADASRHRNRPDWFRPPRLFGFIFADVRPVPFHRVPGNTGFFSVRGVELEFGERRPGPDVPRPSAPADAVPVPTPAQNPSTATVIIIDPPEGKEARRHERHPDPPAR